VIDAKELVQRIKKLPPLPGSVTRFHELLSNEKSSLAEIGQVAKTDPALTANILRVANSAFVAVSRRVEDVSHAVSLLGRQRLRESVLADALTGVLPPILPGFGIDARTYFTHCVAVAILARELAGRTKVTPDTAFLAGLLHDIGKLAVATYLTTTPSDVAESLRPGRRVALETERRLLGFDHGVAGEILATQWRLPESAAIAARWHHAPDRAPPGASPPVAALVHLADALSYTVVETRDPAELTERVDTGALTRLNLSLEDLQRTGDGSRAEIAKSVKLVAELR
jgi:putative nucleotidyltransferase with HDIG domain